jgi:O-antigen/teichoic acid export membrane protein
VRRLYLCHLMRRVLVRRSATALGIYLSVVLGFLATVVAARLFGKETFGLYAIVISATGFFQSLLDVTVEEAVVKYGFRYISREEWGKLRQLVRNVLGVKVLGGLLGALGLVVLAPFSEQLFGHAGLETALFIAAGIPLAQSLEGLAGAALFLRGRYDIRSGFLVWSMTLRLAAIAIGAPHGLVAAIAAVVVAQVIATASIGIVGIVAFRRFPHTAPAPIAEDRRDIVAFVLQSSAATGVISVRTFLTPLLLGIVTSPTQVGYFRVAQAPQSGFQALSAPARMVLLTEQTRDWEHGRRQAVMRGIRNYSVLAGAIVAVAVPLLLVYMPDLIRIVYTSSFVGATNAARVFVLAAAVQFLVGWSKSFPVTIGRPQLRIWTHGMESLVIVPLTVVLGLAWGATGAAVAVLAGTCVFAAMWAVIALRTEAVDAVPT